MFGIFEQKLTRMQMGLKRAHCIKPLKMEYVDAKGVKPNNKWMIA